MKREEIVTGEQFRTVLRPVVSSVAVITARHGENRDGLTATSICSVSAMPPTMLACVNLDAAAERLIAESRAFAINFLTEEQHRIARLFSRPGPDGEDAFGEGTWGTLVSGAPVLEGALVSLDCTVADQLLCDTHRIYVGQVSAATSLDQPALLYRDGQFRRLMALS